MATILVIDDELGIRDLLFEVLNDEGHTVELAENAAQARSARLRREFDLVLLDIWMPDTDGVTLLKEWRGAGLLTMPVIMMSGHATIETAVEATRIGAHSFLEKPITLQKLFRAINHALAKNSVGRSKSAPTPARAAAPPSAASIEEKPQAEPEPPPDPGPQNQQIFDLEKPLREARDAFEKAYFEYHLAKESGSMTKVAEKTGLERTHLYRKLKLLGVDLIPRGNRRNLSSHKDQDDDE